MNARIKGPSRRFILTILIGLTLGFAQASEALEQPRALIIAGKPAKLPGDSRRLTEPLERGVELFVGDTLRNDSGSDALIAFCPSAGAGALLKLGPNASGRITEDGVAAQPPATLERAIPICRLPRVHRIPQPGTEYDPRDQAPEELFTLKADQNRELDQAAAMEIDPQLILLARATKAALLESYGFRGAALRELRAIREAYPETTWTRDVISRLVLESLPEAVPASDVSARAIRDPSQVDLPGSDPDFSTGETYALIVGLSDYPDGKRVTKLRFADKDGELFRTFLKSKRGGNVPDDHIKLLTNQHATRDAIDQALIDFVKGKGGKKNTLIVFVAAHGHYVCTDKNPDFSIDQPCEESKKEPVIIVRDGETEAPTVTGYPMRRLRNLVTERASEFGRVLVYVDVCHGGNVNWRAGDPSLTPSNVVAELEAKGGRLGIMSASSVELPGKKGFEYAYESAKLGHGVFTYYLLKGLNGDVQAVDGKVLFESLFAHVSASVLTFTGKLRQVPEHYRSDAGLVAVDNDAQPDFDLSPTPESSAEELVRRSAAASPDEQQFEQLLPGDLDNAALVLDRIRAQYGEQSPVYTSHRTEYRIALEDRGQEIVVKYLEGDQVRQEPGDFHRCAEYFTRALDITPDAAFDESRKLFCSGRELVFGGDYAGAETNLLRAVRIDPGRPYSYNALGIAYLEQANLSDRFFDPAIAAFQEAIRLAPYWAYPRHNLALALAERGRYLDAIAQYRSAATVAPMYSYLPYNLGLLYQQLNRMDDARVSYRDAERVAQKRCEIRFGPKFTQPCEERALPRTGLGTISVFQHKRKQADTFFRQARQDDPADLLAAHNHAALLAEWKGHEMAAEEIWKAILARDDSHVPTLIGYTHLLKRQHRYEEAIPLLRALAKKMDKYLPAQIDLATALARTENYSEASALLDRLIQDRPQNANAWAAQAELLEQAGNREAARAAWENALHFAAGSPDEKEIRQRRKDLSRSK